MPLLIEVFSLVRFLKNSQAEIVNKIIEKYGVWGEKSMYGKKYMGIERSTFVLDETGKIVKEVRKVKVKDHAQILIDELQ